MTAGRINDWVKDMTNEKIESLIDENMINGLTRLVLVNAIYFKGDWETKFDPKKTQQSPFYVSNVKNIETDMMMLTEEFPRAVIDELDVTMIEMPYKGDRIVMQIVLPNQRSQGLTSVEGKLENVDINDLFQQNQRTVKVQVKLPKFKVSQSSSLSDFLKNLGMEDMFNQGAADFSGIDGSRQSKERFFSKCFGTERLTKNYNRLGTCIYRPLNKDCIQYQTALLELRGYTRTYKLESGMATNLETRKSLNWRPIGVCF